MSSTIPTMGQSAGTSRGKIGKLIPRPRHQRTNSLAPAPTGSVAMRGFPAGSLSGEREGNHKQLQLVQRLILRRINDASDDLSQ